MSDWVDIGEQLRLARERRGETILDVEHSLKIPATVLINLENNDYNNFASPVYSKSFLTQYSEYLDVDATDWINALRSETVITKQKSIEFFRESSDFERPGFHLWNKENTPVLGMIITIVAIGAGYSYYNQLEQQYGENNEPSSSEATQVTHKTDATDSNSAEKSESEQTHLSKKTITAEIHRESL